MQAEIVVITVDGPSGVGKGTLSRSLSKWLNWHFLDSGAIYRALAYYVGNNNIALNDDNALEQAALELPIQFNASGSIMLGHQDITVIIREEKWGKLASEIASKAPVRRALMQKKRAFKQAPGLIADGRDMGTVVFPEALVKFFLDASALERANRRFLQLKTQDPSVTLDEILQDIEARDLRDRTRVFAPLKPAEDAVVIDTTVLGVEQVFAIAKEVIVKRLHGA